MEASLSGTGHFYEIPDEAGGSLTGLSSKSEWYDALGNWIKPSSPNLNAWQELQHGWIWALQNQPPPLGRMFAGDIRTVPDGWGDPEVVFLGAKLVREIAGALVTLDDAFFLTLLGEECSSGIWFRKPLTEFFNSAASRGNAIVVMWGD